jgi:hypothetical protein
MRGSLDLLPAPPGVLAFERTNEDDTRVVAVNFERAPASLGYQGWTVDAASDGEPRRRFGGVLAADAAVVLSPRRGPRAQPPSSSSRSVAAFSGAKPSQSLLK